MPRGRKNINKTSNSSSSSSSSITTNEKHSSIKATYERGSVVWCKYQKHPYWPSIISNTVPESSQILYEVLFFGTLSVGLPIDSKWLEPYEGVDKFKQRLKQLRKSEICIQNKSSQYDMIITKAYSEAFSLAVIQATEVLKCSNSSERLQLADDMRKGVPSANFRFEDDNDDDDDDDDDDDGGDDDEKSEVIEDEEENIEKIKEIEEVNDEKKEEENDAKKKEEDQKGKKSNKAEDSNKFNTSVLSMPTIQNDQQLMETKIIEIRKKRKLEEDEDLSITKIGRITTTNEFDQSSMNPRLPNLFPYSTDQPIKYCSKFVCHSLTRTEETLILHAIAHSDPDFTFFQAKQIAENIYSNIIRLNNNSNRSLPISEVWFYVFFNLHFEQLFSTHRHWLCNLEKSKTKINCVNKQQQQLIYRMKTYHH